MHFSKEGLELLFLLHLLRPGVFLSQGVFKYKIFRHFSELKEQLLRDLELNYFL
jgi:hypothetical protein